MSLGKITTLRRGFVDPAALTSFASSPPFVGLLSGGRELCHSTHAMIEDSTPHVLLEVAKSTRVESRPGG